MQHISVDTAGSLASLAALSAHAPWLLGGMAILIAALIALVIWLYYVLRQRESTLKSLHAQEAALQKQNLLVSTLLENLQIGVFMVEAPSGRPLIANEAARRLLGRGILPVANANSIGEVYKASRLGSNEPYPTQEMPIIRGMYGDASHIDDMVVTRADGTQGILEVFGTPVRNAEGQIWASLVSFHDITASKHAQEIIISQNKELESFLYVASHDMRSPLVNVQGFSHLLAEQLEELSQILGQSGISRELQEQIGRITAHEIPQSLRFITKSVRKMDSLLQGWTQISRTGRLPHNPIPLDMNHLVESVLDTHKFQIDELGAQVELQPLKNCRGDAAQVNQIFANLISNAIKYRHAERTLHIEIACKEHSNSIIYTVRDNGKGIAPHHLERIWDVFFQVDGKQDNGGEGLGLSIVKRLVERHRGRISVRSKLGEGSTFTVEFPRA